MAGCSMPIKSDDPHRELEQTIPKIAEQREPEVRASIVIKSNDQQEYLEQTFPMLAKQTEKSFEVIFAYSGRNQSTVELAKDWGGRGIKIEVVQIEPGKFSHPGVINDAATRAHGDFLVYLSADAIPAKEDWLESLLKPFDDPDVAGVYGRHLPYLRAKGANFLDRFKFSIWYDPTPRRQIYETGHGFSNANSAVRKPLWERHHFDERIPEAEDYEWSLWAEEEGYAIVYDPGAAVYHSHAQRYGILGYAIRALRLAWLRKQIDRKAKYPMASLEPYFLAVAVSLLMTMLIWVLRYQPIISGIRGLLFLAGPLQLALVSILGWFRWLSEK